MKGVYEHITSVLKEKGMTKRDYELGYVSVRMDDSGEKYYLEFSQSLKERNGVVFEYGARIPLSQRLFSGDGLGINVSSGDSVEDVVMRSFDMDGIVYFAFLINHEATLPLFSIEVKNSRIVHREAHFSARENKYKHQFSNVKKGDRKPDKVVERMIGAYLDRG